MDDYTISPRYSAYVVQFLKLRNLDPSPIFSAAGCLSSLQPDSTVPLSPVQLTQLLNGVAAELNDHHIGLTIGASFRASAAGLASLLILSSTHFEHGLRNLLKYDKYVDRAFIHSSQRSSEQITHQFRVSSVERVDFRHIHELLTAQMFAIMRDAIGEQIRATELYFCHNEKVELDRFGDLFGCEKIYKGQRMAGYSIANRDKQRPFITANRVLNEILKNHIKSQPKELARSKVSHVVTREILRLLQGELPTLEAVATELNTSPRTLARRLNEAGVNFAQLRKQALSIKAQSLLNGSQLPLTEIAFQLGYSDSTAFGRAFKQWTGTTPEIYRRRTNSPRSDSK